MGRTDRRAGHFRSVRNAVGKGDWVVPGVGGGALGGEDAAGK